MKNHQIIRDSAKLKEFIDWLPVLKENEVYFVCLQARKKYMPSLKTNDKTQLKRFVASKENLFDKIRQLECPVGCYTTNDGEVIEDEALALYITVNPRDMKKASFNSIKALVDLIQNEDKRNLNPHSEVLSQIHKAKSRSVFVHFDIDFDFISKIDDISQLNDYGKQLKTIKNFTGSSLIDAKRILDSLSSVNEVYEKTVEIVGANAVEIVQTRGGCHVLIRPELVVSKTKNWHPIIVKKLNSDQVGDLMVPVVGCCHGGFTPKLLKF